MDDASFRSFSESLESTPLEHVRFLLDTVCSYPDCGPNAATVDGVLHTVWMASDRSRDAVRAPLVAFAVAEEAALGLSPDAVSPAWLQWASALLHLCSERSSVETGHAVLRQLVEIGLLAAPAVSARRADEHSPLSADTSDSDASEGVDSEAASEAECGQWYHQASNIVCEVRYCTPTSWRRANDLNYRSCGLHARTRIH